MNVRFVFGAALGAAFAPALWAQDEVFDHVALRVASVLPNGDVVVDRGALDHVAIGDRVVLLPRNGVSVFGAVTEVQDRSAVVAPVDRTAVLAPGVKGEVLVPKARRTPPAAAPEPAPKPAAPAEPTKPPPDDGWRPGMPLLAGSKPLHPEERTRHTSGRVWSAVDFVRTLSTFTHSFARVGTDLAIENPFGQGGTLRFDGEFAWETEFSDQTNLDLRAYDLSYTLGGTRFAPTRWQFGRFLPHDMPEFGRLDGVELGRRTEGGQRFGVSLGFLPELDDDMRTGEDLQLATWFLGTGSPDERFTYGLGYQKTLHHGTADRDLVVAKMRVLPDGGFDFAATAWVDFYGGNDTRGDGVDLTRLVAHTARRSEDGSGIELAFLHERYPDVQRTEVPLLQPLTLLAYHQDRLTLHAYLGSAAGSRWFTRLSGWQDQERTGGAAELGTAIADLLADGTRTGLAAFVVQGLSDSQWGLRIDHGGGFAAGRLDVLAEAAYVHFEGFPGDRNDLLQYRVGALWTAELDPHWNLTCHADGTLWDQELSFALGFFLQRTF